MCKSEPKGNPILINYVIMTYELKVRTTGTHRSIGSLKIQLWILFNIPLQKFNYTLIPYINNNKMKFGFVTYYSLHINSLWTGVYNLTR